MAHAFQIIAFLIVAALYIWARWPDIRCSQPTKPDNPDEYCATEAVVVDRSHMVGRP